MRPKSSVSTPMPFVSFIIPTYNAGGYLAACLESIQKQTYDRSRYEVLVIDGGSTDATVAIANRYKAHVLPNPYRDAESGKSIGIQHAKGEIIALVDADNELVENDWLKTMIQPLMKDPSIFGVESPWYVRRGDPLINQYVTLLHIADPLARMFHPTMSTKEYDNYVVYHLKLGQTPVVGANGFLWRKKFIKIIDRYRPKFEEVNYVSLMVQHGFLIYARVKHAGIYHHYCTSLWDYLKKRVKIGRKFMLRKQKRQHTWLDESKQISFALAVLYNLSVIGPGIEAMREYQKTKQRAWVWHPIISFLTIIVYAYIFFEMKIRSLFHVHI